MSNVNVAPRLFPVPEGTGRAIALDYYTGTPGWGGRKDFHYHPEYELVLTRGSFGRSLIGDAVSSYSKLDLVLLAPNIPHVWVADPNPDSAGPTDNVVVHFSRESVGLGLLQKPEFEEVNAMLHASKRGLRFPDARLLKEAEALLLQIVEQEGARLRQYLTFLCLLETLSRYGRPVPLVSDGFDCSQIDRDQEAFAGVLTCLHEHANDPITLKQVARQTNMSVRTLCRLFKRMTGTTLVDYVNAWRVERACILLAETDQSVLDISLRVGFPNLSNFNRQFKRRVGITPREHRLQTRA